MLLAVAREVIARQPEVPAWWKRLSASPVPWFVVAAGAYVVLCTAVGIKPATAFTITWRQQFAQLLLQTLIAVCVVAPAVIVPAERRSWSLRAIGSRPLAYVGMLSYGIYLWHYAVIEWLVRRLGCNPGGAHLVPGLGALVVREGDPGGRAPLDRGRRPLVVPRGAPDDPARAPLPPARTCPLVTAPWSRLPGTRCYR